MEWLKHFQAEERILLFVFVFSLSCQNQNKTLWWQHQQEVTRNKMFLYYNSRASLNEDLARFKLLSLEMSERRCNIFFFRVICQKVIMKRALPRDSLCLSGPEDLWWPWEGLRKQKVEMDLDSFSSKRLNQHFVIVYWCKRLICFHIAVYFYPLFWHHDATERSYFLRVLVPHIQLKNIPVHQTKNFNYTVILRTLTDRGKNQ